ncbi:MAG: 50S ribosomal protein L9 [Candidatus Dadabacteria bacterium]|nr:50S ribosomal protein L9 [Candidatus Dadabacteria bacterium]NIQ14959.1 50S ribosomal protein L9 [Candidatus Dadabacteria bacterium]
MKVILIADVKDLGLQGEIKDVKNGFGRNYLIPQKLAVEATKANLNIWEKKREALEIRMAQILEDANTLAEKLEGLTLTVPMKAGDDERLYGSVTSQNISDLLKEKGFDISRKDIALNESIKNLGSHNIRIKLFREISPEIVVDVIREEEQETAKETVEEETEN